ncbi:MAG: YHS domain protein [Gammaproteobacteria bacterium]|nr:YHS domain protein [Gammaproteobacteria bacterium]
MVSEDGFAIHGYDPVAYFEEGEAKKGSTEFQLNWEGAIWLFSSAESRDEFLGQPAQYAPQYGGWCAFGMAEGYAAETDPLKAWTIHEGRLYLNWNEEVAADWSESISGYLKKSERNWSKIQSKLLKGKAKIYWHKDE